MRSTRAVAVSIQAVSPLAGTGASAARPSAGAAARPLATLDIRSTLALPRGQGVAPPDAVRPLRLAARTRKLGYARVARCRFRATDVAPALDAPRGCRAARCAPFWRLKWRVLPQ